MSAAKTPVSILQEHCSKNKNAPPEYDLIYNRSDGVDPEFKYQVSYNNITAVGNGRSKKEAKHNAAELAIMKLNNEIETSNQPITEPLGEPVASPYTNMVQRNYVGELMEYCADAALPEPKFQEESAEGPSHAPNFTISCTVSQLKETAKATTKKQAKQLVAKKLHQRIAVCLRDTVKVDQNLKAAKLVAPGEAEENIFEMLHDVPNIPATIMSNCTSEMHLTIKNKFSETPQALKNVDVDRDRTNWNAKKQLQEVATEMNIGLKIEVSPEELNGNFFPVYDDDCGFDMPSKTPNILTGKGEKMYIAMATLQTNPPTVVIGIGNGHTEAEANAAEKVLDHLSIMIEGLAPELIKNY